ncbi:basic helix-loop-helix transcription factor [Lithospermum erythrorhizon]|uniref:Basic helix-loop-helix transcription factor n=1 Tax=Lithospermum erythrorhizon TaxID=34254 RepID=A0AAV3R9G4_LITER
MALDAIVYPQNNIWYGLKELFMLGDSSGLGYDEFDFQEQPNSFVEMLENNIIFEGLNNNWESSSSSILQNVNEWDHNNNTFSPVSCTGSGEHRQVLEGYTNNVEAEPPPVAASAASTRPKRRRMKPSKNKEELENQRMTHITVERNRRKQMNDYLAIIRSLMPPSYVQRGDQASIVGGAINFVKELEQQLQSLEAQKRAMEPPNDDDKKPPLFSNFFTFPQYSTTTTTTNEMAAQHLSTLGDIEVTVVESHANLKIMTKKRPRQLLKIVAGLQCVSLTILHVNVTTLDHIVLYSVSVKVEEGCHLTTVDEIADAVNNLLGRIEEEATLS